MKLFTLKLSIILFPNLSSISTNPHGSKLKNSQTCFPIILSVIVYPG